MLYIERFKHNGCSVLMRSAVRVIHLLHVVSDVKSAHMVRVSVHLFSPCPYKCIIFKFLLYVKVTVMKLFLKIKCYQNASVSIKK